MAKTKTDIIPFDQFLEKEFLLDSYTDVNENFSNCLNKKGVWACFGLPKDRKSGWVCLNVGSSNKIGIEMRTNLKYSEGKFTHRKGVYKNFEGNEVFKFVRPKNEPITIRERVWKNIGENYEQLHFVVIFESKIEKERLKKEMEFAKIHKAKYWNPSPKQRKMMAEETI